MAISICGTMTAEQVRGLELLKKAFTENDAAPFRQLLERYPRMKTRINDPISPFDSPAVTCVRSP